MILTIVLFTILSVVRAGVVEVSVGRTGLFGSVKVFVEKYKSSIAFDGISGRQGSLWKGSIGTSNDMRMTIFPNKLIDTTSRFKVPRSSLKLAQIWRPDIFSSRNTAFPESSGDYFCIYGKLGSNAEESAKALYFSAWSGTGDNKNLESLFKDHLEEIKGSQAFMWTSEVPCGFSGLGPVNVHLKSINHNASVVQDSDTAPMEGDFAQLDSKQLVGFAIANTEVSIVQGRPASTVHFMEFNNNKQDRPYLKRSYGTIRDLQTQVFGSLPVTTGTANTGYSPAMCFAAAVDPSDDAKLKSFPTKAGQFLRSFEIMKKEGTVGLRLKIELKTDLAIPDIVSGSPSIYRLLFWPPDQDQNCNFLPNQNLAAQ